MKININLRGYLLLIAWMFAIPLPEMVKASGLPTSTPALMIKLTVKYLQSNPEDTLHLTVNNAVFSQQEAEHYWAACDKSGIASFDIPVKKRIGYFTLTKKRTFTGAGEMDLIYPQLWEAGDSISMEISHKETGAGIYSTVNFSGKGWEKYSALQALMNTRVKGNKYLKLFSGNVVEGISDTLSLGARKKLEVLQQYRPAVSTGSYQVLMADVIAMDMNFLLTQSKQYYMDKIRTDTTKTKSLYLNRFQNVFFPVKKYELPDSSLASSKDYLNYLYSLCVFTAFIKDDYNTKSIFKNIVENFTGLLRERLLMKFFLNNGSSNEMEALYHSSAKQILDIDENTAIGGLFKDTSNASLPDYFFTNLKGAKIKFSDFKRKVILIDIWFTGCGNCTEYYKAVLSKAENKYAGAKNVIILSVCADKSQSLWKRSVQANQYTGEKAINVYTNGQGFNHPMFLKYRIDSAPTIIIINKEGKISDFNTYELRDYKTLVEAVNRLK